MTVDDLMALADAYAHNTADELWQNRMRDDGVPVDCYAWESCNALFAAIEAALAGAIMAERERCAKVCESEASIWEADDKGPAIEARLCAARIRSMGAAAIRKGEQTCEHNTPTPDAQPVAWRAKAQCGMYQGIWEFSEDSSDLLSPEPLYTHPPQRKPLTDAEIERLEDRDIVRQTAIANLHGEIDRLTAERDALRQLLREIRLGLDWPGPWSEDMRDRIDAVTSERPDLKSAPAYPSAER